MWKDRPVGFGTVALLIAAWALIVYGAVMSSLIFLIVLFIGPAALVPNVILFGLAYLLYIALGISLHFGIRLMYFMALAVTVLMILWHISTITVVTEPVPASLALPFIVVNLFIILALVAGYTGLESRTVAISFAKEMRDRLGRRHPRCPNCGSRSIQAIGPGEGQCNFCGKTVP